MKLGPYELGRVHRVEALAALRALPDASVDMLLTDPPYSSGGATQSKRNADPAKKYVQHGTKIVRASFTGDNRDGRSWAYWSTLWLTECFRILKDGAYALTFSDWRQLPLATDAFQAGGFIWRGIIAWDKTDRARPVHPAYFKHQCEYVVWGTKGQLSAGPHAGPWPGAFRHPVLQSDKWHLTGKPTELMRQLVRVVPEGSVVLDPFAGSGTTLVACGLEGRVGLGFELEEANLRIAHERIDASSSGRELRRARGGQGVLLATGVEAGGDPT